MRSLVQRLKRVWHTPVEFYGVDRPEPQAGSWHGLLLFVLLLVVLGLLWLVRYLPERTVLVHGHPPEPPLSCCSGGTIVGRAGPQVPPPAWGRHCQLVLRLRSVAYSPHENPDLL
jgi:hypothetical protein